MKNGSTSRAAARHASRLAVFGFGLALALALAAAGCGGRQRPPEQGTCHPGREWVPPQQVNGQWRDGYCQGTAT